MIDLETIRRHALTAYKSSSAWAFTNNYTMGVRTIAYRTPDSFTYRLSSFSPRGYANAATCSVAAARAHIRKLVVLGEATEEGNGSNWVRFRLSREIHDQIGTEIIASLVAEGLPFDDDWLAERNQKVSAV